MKITGRISLLSIALTAALVCTTTARANTTSGAYSGTFTFTSPTTYAFNFNIVQNSGKTANGDLTFTVTSVGGDYYGITGVNGVVNPPGGGPITVNDTGLLYDSGGYLTAPDGLIQYDNILNLSGSGTIFDQYGLYLTLGGGAGAGGDDLNFYYSGGQSYFVVVDNQGSGYEVDDSNVIPEPSTWMLLGSGFFMLAGLAWKSRREGLKA
jgi:hypothetical protein